MNNIISYDVSNYNSPDIALNLIKKLDLRKKDRMRSFFQIAELIHPKSINIKFFESLILKIDKYRLSAAHKSKNSLEIKNIIESAHREIAENHIKQYLNNK